MGRRAVVVGGSSATRTASLLQRLADAAISTVVFSVAGEPTVDTVKAGLDVARLHQADLVIGMGGGSVLDTGKALAALLTNGGEPLDYLEVVGRGLSLEQPSAPYIAIPTTSGTGAEVTRNAVLGVREERVKVSLRSPHMLPDLALVDPLVSADMPPALTASTGLDALTQCMEPFVSVQANPLTDALCREGLTRSARSLRRAYDDGSDLAAREGMSLASLLGGLALANAKLGAVHGFAGPLGGIFPIPHGVVCARLLPFVMEANVRTLQSRAPHDPALERYTEVARLVTGSAGATIADGVKWVQGLCADLGMPSLSHYGVNAEHIPDVVEKSARSSSMKGNPISLSVQELSAILIQAL
jgi:alcohol dehydrogenase class IV